MAYVVFLALTDLTVERIGWVLMIVGLQLMAAGARRRRSAAAAAHPRFAVLRGGTPGPVDDVVPGRALRE